MLVDTIIVNCKGVFKVHYIRLEGFRRTYEIYFKEYSLKLSAYDTLVI